MQKCNENAANRYSYVGEVYTLGERAKKNEILSSLPKEWRELHEKGFIHIHDLDAYGLTYNCLTFDILRDFPYDSFAEMSQTRKIIATFEYLKNLAIAETVEEAYDEELPIQPAPVQRKASAKKHSKEAVIYDRNSMSNLT